MPKDKNQNSDPTAVPTIKLPTEKKAKRNEPNYYAKRNLKGIEPKHRTQEEIASEDLKKTQEVLKDE